ncbi:rRNA-processing protein utp23 homolog [Phtheirospermum japonicum]|uniref:rRNA-processing protein utp23 homolog n=1 Tax=Phtheirospermum japonicum TaxID=374723 RepID=A0A830D164_9LAMI|nr:rRNA-processing protein utp23 homolog [Phtheirospermum japonicum]
MRVKKQKRHRRAVRFYTACFGFREPFKILCDGTFVHHLLANRITPADTALANILGAPVKIFTTRCVLAELRSLGDSYSDSLDAARNLMTARCDHEKRKSAVACITEVIGENNSEHFFVATQDAELRKKFQEIPGVPVIYGLRNALFLDRPSTFQHEFVKTAEEERSHMTDMEYKMLRLKKKKAAADEANDLSDANEDHILETLDLKKGVKTNRIDTKDKAQFKRKRAKGPNPLSCKKKKSEGNTRATSASGEEISADNSMRSKSRKRKRLRKSKITTEPIVG